MTNLDNLGSTSATVPLVALPSTVGVCACGSDDPAGCLFFNADYPWCLVFEDHHRPPACPVDTEGCALAPCGCRWRDVDEGRHACETTGAAQ